VSPRQSGGRRTPGAGHTQQPIGTPPVALDGGGSPFGHRWSGGPPGSSYGGNDPTTLRSRRLSVSSSIVGSILPVYYGAREMKATGQWWLWHRTSDTSWFGFMVMALSEGELGSISDIELNDVPIDELVGSLSDPETYVFAYDDREGADTQTLPSLLTTAGVPDLVETWPGLAYVAVKLDVRDESPIPSSMRLTAKITGRKVSDFRTGGAAAATSNPVVIAYDLLTNTEFGLGRATSLINTTNWTAAANHCDTAMADGTYRYEWNGPIAERNLLDAIQMVLGHALMEMEFDPVSGQYIIKTSESGLSSVATIEESDWRTRPKWFEIPLRERPNHVTVSYTDRDSFRPASVHVEDPAGIAAGELRQVELDFPGCYNASIATRIAVKRYNHAATEKYRWHGRVGPVVADVLPGELVTFSSRRLSNQLARLVTKKQINANTYEIELVEYDANTDSTAVATDDDPPSVVVDPPDPPTATDKIYGEGGDWESRSLLPDPDDITTSQGWTLGGSGSASFSSGNEETTFTADADPTETGLATLLYELNSVVTDGDLYMVTFLAKAETGSGFSAGWDSLAATEQGSVEILADGLWHRYRFFAEANTFFGSNKVGFGARRKTAATDLVIARCHAVKVIFNPALKLYERQEWTEDPSASSTVDHYAAYSKAGFEYGRVPVGEAVMEIETLSLGFILHDPPISGFFPDGPFEADWLAIGPTNLSAAFPDPTTVTRESRSFGQGIYESGDVLITSPADGEALVYDGTAGLWKNEAVLTEVDDSDVDLSGTHTGLLAELSGIGTVADAMDILDDLEDDDIPLSGTHTGNLSGETKLADAMDVLDDMSTEFETRQQIMGGEKTSVSDNTVTTVVTFTMPTGPSTFVAGLSFKGSSADSTDAAAVWIQGILKCVRVSGGTVTAEWIETANETLASGSETFGTCEVTENVSGADVQVRVQLDSSLDQSWTVKWTALMSDDVTVAAA
jgi:hypothetical protein